MRSIHGNTSSGGIAAPPTPRGSNMSANTDKAKGKVKQAVGSLTGNESLEQEGKDDEAAGKVKDVLKDVEDKAEELVDEATKVFRRD